MISSAPLSGQKKVFGWLYITSEMDSEKKQHKAKVCKRLLFLYKLRYKNVTI